MSDNYDFDFNNDAEVSDNAPAIKKIHIVLIVLFVIIVGSIAVRNVNEEIEKQEAYDRVIEQIKQEQYIDAICNILGLKYSEDEYPDLEMLEDYCHGMKSIKRKDYISAAEYLEGCVNEDWDHDDLRQPADVLQEIKPLEEEQIAENRRIAEEEERIREENWRKNGAPYVGMKESEITKTSIGEYSKTGTNFEMVSGRVKYCNLYYWFNSNGGKIYSVRCCDGEVIQVWDSRDKPRTMTYYKPSDSDDEYNVKDYYNAEDFYDDHYYDFFDYYDAENYYEEHGGF